MEYIYHLEDELFATYEDAMAWRKAKGYTSLPDRAELKTDFLSACGMFETLRHDEQDNGLSVLDCLYIAAAGPQ